MNYPPIIEGKLPAFVKGENKIIIAIPFKLSKAVSLESINNIVLRIKTIMTGVEKITPWPSSTSISFDTVINSYVATFEITGDNINNLISGQYYKAQLAFVDKEDN